MLFKSLLTETQEREVPKPSVKIKSQVFRQTDASPTIHSQIEGPRVPVPGQWQKSLRHETQKNDPGKCFRVTLLWAELRVFSLKSGYFIFSFGKSDLVLFDPSPKGVLKKNMKYLWSALSFRGSNVPIYENWKCIPAHPRILSTHPGCTLPPPRPVRKPKDVTHAFATFL